MWSGGRIIYVQIPMNMNYLKQGDLLRSINIWSGVHARKFQFGCGILKMVGPKKQDFWPRINIFKGFFLIRR